MKLYTYYSYNLQTLITLRTKYCDRLLDQETNSQVKYFTAQGHTATIVQSLNLKTNLPDPKIHTLKHYESGPPNLVNIPSVS